MTARAPHAALMDGVYRRQRHIYDATRKFFLFGRDRLLDELAPAPGDGVLEVGCGTGRNLVLAARRYPEARFHGLDISRAMLDTARHKIDRAALSPRIALAEGDATGFDPQALFGRAGFERVFFSYTLSMVPDWRAALTAGIAATAPGGRLHIVDFGQQERLPGLARSGLRAWLRLFHVHPQAELRAAAEAAARTAGRPCAFTALHGGYAWSMVIGPEGG